MPGSIPANLHEGSRSEYLAQFVFSSFGTSVPVPHQEDSGVDLHCTLVERKGQLAWPRSHYSVQVKSTMDPWVFDSPESVRWIIEHPLPIFLCIVTKKEARIRVYHTAPRFAVWILPELPSRLELIPGTENNANAVDWSTVTGESFELKAPILDFSANEMLGDDFHSRAKDVLQFWIDCDMENLLRIRSGINRFKVPGSFTTNGTDHDGWVIQGMRFRPDSLRLAESRLKELLALVGQHYLAQDVTCAALCAMALRQLSKADNFRGMDSVQIQYELNRHVGKDSYVFAGCDFLIEMVATQLSRQGNSPPGEPAPA